MNDAKTAVSSCLCLAYGAAVSVALGAAAHAQPADTSSPIENSVVKVFSTMRFPDPFKPGQAAPNEVSGSGVVIEGRRILTNAHVVLYASQVQVQAGAGYSARDGGGVAPGIDLAVLQPTIRRSSTRIPPSGASKLPHIKDAVLAYASDGGIPCNHQGIVSRIEFVSYNYPSRLRIQVTRRSNPATAADPRSPGQDEIGSRSSKLSGDAQNIGYIIPTRRLSCSEGPADGHYDGKPAMYDDLQTSRTPPCDYLKLDKKSKACGSHPARADAEYPLKELGRREPHRRCASTIGHGQDRQGLARELRLFESSRCEQRQAAHRWFARQDLAVQLPVSAEPDGSRIAGA